MAHAWPEAEVGKKKSGVVCVLVKVITLGADAPKDTKLPR